MSVILEETSPDENLRALVEDDGKTVILYLQGEREESFRTTAVWVRNRAKAPSRLEIEPAFDETPLLMPAGNCRHPGGAPAIAKQDAELVWLPEGNGVALYERGDLLAAITPGSGMEGFLGYARDAIGHGALAWEIPEGGILQDRFEEARRYWAAWRQSPDPWEILHPRQLEAYERQLGPRSSGLSPKNRNWPPMELIRIDRPDATFLVTAGVCLRPQPNVELYYAGQPRPLHRIELGVALPPGTGEELIGRFAGYIGWLSHYPWSQFTWLSQGHSVRFGAWEGSAFTAVLLADSLEYGPRVELDDWDGRSVWLLWTVPVTEKELDLAKANRSDAVLPDIPYPRPLS